MQSRRFQHEPQPQRQRQRRLLSFYATFCLFYICLYFFVHSSSRFHLFHPFLSLSIPYNHHPTTILYFMALLILL